MWPVLEVGSGTVVFFVCRTVSAQRSGVPLSVLWPRSGPLRVKPVQLHEVRAAVSSKFLITFTSLQCVPEHGQKTGTLITETEERVTADGQSEIQTLLLLL